MDYRTFASDLPSHRTNVFASVEECEETMRLHGVNQPMRQLGKGRFRSALATLETDEAALFADRFNVSLSMVLEPPAGMVGLLFPRTPSGQFLASGENAGVDRLIVFPPGSASDIVIPELAGSEAIAIPESRFIELTERLCLQPKLVRPQRLTFIDGDTAQLQALRKVVVDLVSHPDSDPFGEQISNVVARTIAWMGDACNARCTDASNGNGVRRRVAKLAQGFIEENYREAVRLEDLCSATGVGVRTLQRCFREYFDLTITEYLKTVRLDAARRELAAVHASQRSVTTIALQHGLSHLGRFSVEFRERFGESPSTVLAAAEERNDAAALRRRRLGAP